MIIYKITNKINNKVYIGQTVQSLSVRYNQHLKCLQHGDTRELYCAMRKYGLENFEPSVICSVSSLQELNELESFYIKKYDSYNNGYNMTLGGENNPMFIDEVKQKHLKTVRSPEFRKKVSETMKHNRKTYGFTEETKRKISQSLKKFYADGKRPNYKVSQHLTPEHYKALNEAKYKKVYCVDMDGNKVKEFNCVLDAAKWWYEHGRPTKSHYRNLSNAIKRSSDNNKYDHGLKWVYVK